MANIFFYTFVIGLASGIFFRSFFDMGFEGVLFLLALSFALALAWRLRIRPYRSLLFLSSLFVLSLGVGVLRLDFSEQGVPPLRSAVGETRVWEGIVVREPDMRPASQHLYVAEKETDELILVIADPYALVEYGDRISVKGMLTAPEPFETDTGRTFDYTNYLKARGVREMISRGEVRVLHSDEGNLVLRTLFDIKHTFMEILERAIPEPAVGLGEGLLLGVKRALGEEITEVFRIAGIMHIVVLSGYNIMIVADFVMRLLEYFFFPRTRLILGVTTIVLFALMVGLSATVVRASFMAVLVLIARHIGRRYAVLRALCITGVVMVFLNPYLLAFDPGFQLSFLATLGLVLIAPAFEERFTYVPTIAGLRGYLATTIGTQLYVLPVLLFSMGTLSLVSVLVNILVLPMVPFAMLATFVVGLVGMLSDTIALGLGFGAHLTLAYIIKVAELASALPYAALTIPAFLFWLVIIMYVLLGIWTWQLTQGRLPATPVNRNSSEDKNRKNDYEGWVIEEEKEMLPGTQSVPGSIVDPLPFR